LFEIARALVRFDHVASFIENVNQDIMWTAVKVVFSRELELAAELLLSGWAILDRLHLLRGLVSLLWRDQYGYSRLHGSAGIDGQRQGCRVHVARQIRNDYEVVAPKGIVVGFQSPTHSFD
jgi:hypothetical protein